MRSASSGLIALLNSSNQLLMADLYTINLVGGSSVYYTNADIDLVVGSTTYRKFRISRSKTRVSIGIEVDELGIEVNPSSDDLLGGASWASAVRDGALDSATLTLHRIFMPTWGDTSLGGVMLFNGRISDVTLGRTEVKIRVKSELELLDTQMPRNLYQSGCLNTLFDNACAINKATLAISGTVTSSTRTQVNSALSQANDYFSLGTIKFTSGINNGVTRAIRSYSAGSFTVFIPYITAPSSGDTFVVHPGCDKMQSTCTNKFNNLVNFRGYPYVPDPETAT